MPMRILNIAEKPSVARSISSILCGGNMNKRRGKHKYTMVYEFDYDGKTMIFTSVLGHLYNYEFVKENINYGENENNTINYDENEGCNKYKNIYNMFNAPIGKKVLDSKIVDNIYYNLRNIDKILIWTDCDREGENIAQEIYDTIIKSNNDKINNRMVIKRIRFSAIEKTHLINAIQTECDINLNEAYAVDARMELDLRIGIIMSRLQSNYFRELNEKSNIGLFEHNNISKDKNKFIMVTYGPCQIPTLNFVVEREDSIINFIEEDFYSLEINIKKKMENIFKWNRNRVFDKKCITHLYDYLTNSGINENGCNNIVTAKIINVAETTETRFRPLPLRTVELQKICTRLFNVSAFDLMSICEKLYINGYISYPRTETDCFKANFNYKNIVDKIASDKDLGVLVDKLKRINGKNSDSTNIKYYARKGKNDDNAHSPIYPLKSGDNLTDKMQRNIYYYIANRFLASISKDAKISKIKVELNMKDEIFTCTGVKILEYNYLEIYKYDKVTEKEIDKFTMGEEFPIHKTNNINNIKITEGKTTPPTYLTEPELISLMDKYGIGTDSTIHEHINKIITRKYSIKKTNKIEPLPLGRILIHGYNRINCCYIDNNDNNGNNDDIDDDEENKTNTGNNTNTILYPLNKPMLRSNLELKLKEIEKGAIIKNKVIEEEIKIYKRIFNIIVNNLYKFKEEVEDNNNYVTTIKNNNKRNNNSNRSSNNSNSNNNNNRDNNSNIDNNRSIGNNNSNRGNNNRNGICN
ncbi:DNA topoisomerase III, partial [Spraguea lophii 42_110]